MLVIPRASGVGLGWSEKTASDSVLRGDGRYRFRCGPPWTGSDRGFRPNETPVEARVLNVPHQSRLSGPRPKIQEAVNQFVIKNPSVATCPNEGRSGRTSTTGSRK